MSRRLITRCNDRIGTVILSPLCVTCIGDGGNYLSTISMNPLYQPVTLPESKIDNGNLFLQKHPRIIAPPG